MKFKFQGLIQILNTKREYSVGIPCTNFAISLLILHPAAPNLAFHHYLGSRTIDRRDF